MAEEARKKPFRRAEFFDLIMKIIEDKGLVPDGLCLDYALATSELKDGDLDTYAFDVQSNLDFGGNEGIYIDLGIWRYRDGKRVIEPLGTIKTLDESDDAMRLMGSLLGSLVAEIRHYVNAHLEDFDWYGYKVTTVYFDQKRNYGSYHPCDSREEAEKYVESSMSLGSVVGVKVYDNRARKEIKAVVKEGYVLTDTGYKEGGN